MGTCTGCKRREKAPEGCCSSIALDGIPYERIPHGTSPFWGYANGPCRDCGVSPGKIHHLGCQYEQCPKCADPQMVACDCAKSAE